MRIRKNAKLCPLLYATSSLQAAALLQTYVCQLNQSPWDVMTFSPPSSPFQANGSDVRAGNASSDSRDSVSERELSSGRSSEYPNATPKVEAAKEETPPPPPPPPVENEATILCCKTDEKSRRDTAKGKSVCDKGYSNGAQHAAKKSFKPAAKARRRSRPKKFPAALSANPYAIYYYTGFGPRWRGKQRGEGSSSNGSPENVQVAAAAAAISDEDLAYSECEDEDDDEEEEEEEEKEEEEEEEEEKKDNGKKRARKPIKARSLKSLL